jgi:hypothetical protein
MDDIKKTKENKEIWKCSLCQNTTSKDENMYQISIPEKFRRVCNSCLHHDDYFNIVFKQYAKFIKERIVLSQKEQEQKQENQQTQQMQQQPIQKEEKEPVDYDYKLFVAIDNGDIYNILKLISESNEKVDPKHLNHLSLKRIPRQYMSIILEYYSKNEYKNKPITVYSQLGQFILYYMFQVHRFYNPQPMLMHFIVFKLMDLPNNTTFDDVVNAIDLMIFPDESEMEDKMPSIKYYNRIRELVLNE